MKILAIDTSSKVCSVSITEDDKKIVELHNDDEKTHSVKLMPMIDELFKSTNLNLSDIDLLVCSIGPGSFTGLRIGVATIKAFADTQNINTVPVTSLEGLVYNMIEDDSILVKKQLPNTLFCSIIDAKNDNVYYGLYRYYNDCLNETTELSCDNINTLISKINILTNNFDNQFNSIVFVGDGSSVYRDLLEKNLTNPDILTKFAENEQNNSNSVSIAIAGYKKYLNGNYGDSSILSPLYLRKPQAELNLNKNNSN